MSRPYTIVIYGASGFTGQFIIEDLVKYLSRNRETDIKWAAGGRNESKIRNTLTSVGKEIGMNLDDIPILTATAEDSQSLDQLTSQCSVLINCTGPFRFYGEPVVAACIRNGCHYVDVTGEPQFMEMIQLKYQAEATEKGVYVICGCGLDSIPCDIGISFTRDSFNGTVDSVESYLIGIGDVTANVTTWECAVEGFADVANLTKIRRQLHAEQFAEPSKIKPKYPIGRKGIHKVDEPKYGMTGRAMPFPGADRSVVKRSQMANYTLFDEKSMIQMEAYMVQSLWKTMSWCVMGVWIQMFAKCAWGRKMLKSYPSFFTFGLFRKGGPNKEEIDAGSFSIVFKGLGWKSAEDQDHRPTHKIVTKVSGPHPGYPACATCVNQAVLTLLNETDRMPLSGGVHTPGTAFRKTSLVQRLNANGIKFTVLENDS